MPYQVRQLLRAFILLGLGTICLVKAHAKPHAACGPDNTIHGEIVALEQAIVLNRYGAFNPAGMLFALRRDVVFHGHRTIADGTPVTAANLSQAPGHVKLRDDKRPRPIVLRVNEGQCLEVRLHNLLMRGVPDERLNGPEQYRGAVPAHIEDASGVVYNQSNTAPTGRDLVRPQAMSNDLPRTRAAAFHVNGLDLVPVPATQCPPSTADRPWLCGTDGDNVGLNIATVNPATPQDLRERLQQQGGQIYPGQSALYRMIAKREGTYFAYSTGATVGGEGDGGQLGAGLFGAVNVQPKGAKWYRSQVTHADLRAAARATSAGGHPYSQLDYDGARYQTGPQRGVPILAMLDRNEIVHTDLNAVVVLTGPAPDRGDTTSPNRSCNKYVFGNSCGHAYREFTVIMHDEVKAVQAFAELEDESNPLHYIKDGMGINYGVGGMGAMVVARNRRTGPVKDCPECRAEEFFLSSWANGDPALVLRWGRDGKNPVGALYPDDPSNVHHSYLSDPVRFRNIHAGPKETHVFHLHAHQWVQDASAPGSTYLDSQTISPGATFSYEIEFGGSGNRNLSPGDSIFHCHLYPHFAQGMWELWRVHDVFEDGGPTRRLPDAEVSDGTENPALVPLPGSPLALMPTQDFKGYPFYIAGQAGHRPPQPPLDFDTSNGTSVDGGLQRHVLTGWEKQGNTTLRALANQDVLEAALAKGGLTAQINAQRVYRQNPNALTALAEEWKEIGGVKLLDPQGEQTEQQAMAFHAGRLTAPGFEPIRGPTKQPQWDQEQAAYRTHWSATVSGQPASAGPALFHVNGREPVAGAPFADPCPVKEKAPRREYRVGVIQTELTVNRHGWFDPQARILALENDIQDIIDPDTRDRIPEPLFFRANSGDCINFKHSNFVPSALAVDDFQIYTPTDTIGQHIHLVKFDVTSSDGSGNGWNYEDGTFSPEEVRERVHAINASRKRLGTQPPLKLKTHPLFTRSCADDDERCKALKTRGKCPDDAHEWSLKELSEKHPFCGAQRTVQRWYADPIFDPKTGRDYTLRTVFTHDHFGPSSHQQHGLYAALVIEPSNSVWLDVGSNSLAWDKLCSADPAIAKEERKKVLGGANLADTFDSECKQRIPNVAVGAGELREPLKLRDDGGPTATRANIVAPLCLSGRVNGGARNNSNPLDPKADLTCAADLRTKDTRREQMLAFADFAVLYNTALEPINPEERDASALRFGRRQAAINRPKPLAISSEDPGSQLINYRHEPVPLRITDRTADELLGGFNYRQTPCTAGDLTCTGDMANVFSTSAHANRDLSLATTDYGAVLSIASRDSLAGTPLASKVDGAMAKVERWRRDFNCALYPEVPNGPLGKCQLRNLEPWRVMGDPATPVLAAYEGDPLYIRLVQGAQEAQHVFTMTGNKWLREPDNPQSGFVNSQPLGISEHFEFDVTVTAENTARSDTLYAGSSIDQFWDGMWGLMRSFRATADRPTSQLGLASLNDLRGNPVPKAVLPANLDRGTQMCAAQNVFKQRLYFDISAVRACDLTETCGRPLQRGIAYNERLGIDDPNAVVFVRNNRSPGDKEPTDFNINERNAEVLKRLRLEFNPPKASGKKPRRVEPLILRAPAGACMEVQLRNHLPPVLQDGEIRDAQGREDTAHFSDNFMSMITDGFNYNQLRMSSSVGLTAPMMAYGRLQGGGANFGINAMELRALSPGSAAQGTLVPPCPAGNPEHPSCTSETMTWYAGNYALDHKGAQVADPIEFGAVPLTSFGDVIKHAAHGAMGALVIGPTDSSVCLSNDKAERDADQSTDTSASICDKTGAHLYRDFVMVLQDAVDAKINGDRIPNLKGAEEPDDYGVKAVNYRTEPLWGRRGGDPSIEFSERGSEFDYAGVLSSKAFNNSAGKTPITAIAADAMVRVHGFKQASKLVRCQAGIDLLPSADRHVCDPETPLFVARAGREVRMRVVHPGGHTRQQAITLHGHHWNPAPWQPGSKALASTHRESTQEAWTLQGSFNGVGPFMAANLLVHAGGQFEVPMDYLWRSQASFVFDGGVWGLLRVLPPNPVK